MSELTLRPVEPKKTDDSTRIVISRSVRFIYLDDLRALHKVFWDMTQNQRNQRTERLRVIQEQIADNQRTIAKLQDSSPSEPDNLSPTEWRKTIARLRALGETTNQRAVDGLEASYLRQEQMETVDSLDSTELYLHEIKSLQREAEVYRDRPEIVMKSDEYYFDSLDDLESLGRNYIDEFEIRSSEPWCSVTIRKDGTAIFWTVDGGESEHFLTRVETIINRRKSSVLEFLFEGPGFYIILLVGALSWLGIRFTPNDYSMLSSIFALLLFMCLFTIVSLVIGVVRGRRTRVVPIPSSTARNTWRDRGPEIVISLIGAIAVVIAAILASV